MKESNKLLCSLQGYHMDKEGGRTARRNREDSREVTKSTSWSKVQHKKIDTNRICS